ncbi:DUF1573 domain-containing protein [Flavobacterium litorale]|uniref:DUF1573 domain-containing protein n=1 Tax=Flavobacterium litorale TaxID=2856519 RepID=A0ABX8VD58_9FLAO|nr:DUF1573 domain-containing protein [Flavobacterium litorale]QYJ68770.1 DUF1573 domain-containing protein [Flavobacterium litorale]
MKKLGILLFCITSIISCNNLGNPIIEIINPEIDLGTIPHNDKRDFYIKIRNGGTSDLIIKKLQPSCSCIVDKEFELLTIKAKKTDSIKLTMVANNYGNHTEKVAILSNTESGYSIVNINSYTEKPEQLERLEN